MSTTITGHRALIIGYFETVAAIALVLAIVAQARKYFGHAPGPVAAADRRHRGRQETIEEILDIAVQIMAEQRAHPADRARLDHPAVRRRQPAAFQRDSAGASATRRLWRARDGPGVPVVRQALRAEEGRRAVRRAVAPRPGRQRHLRPWSGPAPSRGGAVLVRLPPRRGGLGRDFEHGMAVPAGRAAADVLRDYRAAMEDSDR